MLYAFYPVGPDTTMMSSLLGHVHAPHGSSYPTDSPNSPSQSKPRREQSTRRRLSKIFSRSPKSPSVSETSSDAGSELGLSSPKSAASDASSTTSSEDSKSFTKSLFRRQSSAAVSTKTSSSSESTDSKESRKDKTRNKKPKSTYEHYLSTNEIYPSAWSYVIW